MATTTIGRHSTAPTYETHSALTHPLLSWRSVIAGLIIAGFIADVCISLGVALGGVTLKGGMSTSEQTLGIIGGVWFLVSCLIGLFCGGYFAARISKLHTSRLAGSQGVLITALFFAVMAFGLMSFVGMVGNAAGSVASAASNAAAAASNSSAAQNKMNNVSSTDIKTQVNDLKAQVSANAPQIRDNAADAMQAIGWSMFVSMVLGAICAFGGGSLGAYRNVRRPLLVDDTVGDATLTGAMV